MAQTLELVRFRVSPDAETAFLETRPAAVEALRRLPDEVIAFEYADIVDAA